MISCRPALMNVSIRNLIETAVNHDDQSAFKNSKIIPRWVKFTLLWEFMSNLKLALQRMPCHLSAGIEAVFFQTFIYRTYAKLSG